MEFVSTRQADQFSAIQKTMRETLQEFMQQNMRLGEQQDADSFHTVESSKAATKKARRQHRKTQERAFRQIERNLTKRNLLLDPKDPQRAFEDVSAIVSEVVECSSKILEEDKWLLNSFRFPVMRDREENITEAERATFEWVFDKSDLADGRWDNFPQWFASEKPLYWFSGKAGSGKSTLMKHVFSHEQTTSLIKSWAKEVPVVAAGFFFWNAGGPMQKSQEGLLQSLIYQLLVAHRELIPVVFQASQRQDNDRMSHEWSKAQLKDLLEGIVFQTAVPLKICLFIDGLDEYHGDYGDLTEFITLLAQNDDIKICVSSRPYSLFEVNFKGLPRLKLEQLTHDDIVKYSSGKFSANQRVRKLQENNPDIAGRLAAVIVKKACGVFLWVKLVVRSLCEGLDKFDRSLDLEERLHELPEDLLKLYMHMLMSIEKRYVRQASKLLEIVYRANKPLTLLQLGFADMEDGKLDAAWKADVNSFSEEDLGEICSSTEGRLRSRCLGLIEVSSSLPPNADSKSRAAEFMHKTVVDFLEDEWTKNYLIESQGGYKFNPYPSLMKANILAMKHSATSQSRQSAMVLAQNWFQFSWANIKSITRYAAVQEIATSEPQTATIQELEKVSTRLAQLYVENETRHDVSKHVHWSERRHEGVSIHKIQQRGSLLSFCLEFGLYITAHDILGLNSKPISPGGFSKQEMEFALLIEEEANERAPHNGTSLRPVEWAAIREYLNKATHSPLRSFLKLGRSKNKRSDETSRKDRALILKARQFPANCRNGTEDLSDDHLILQTAFL